MRRPVFSGWFFVRAKKVRNARPSAPIAALRQVAPLWGKLESPPQLWNCSFYIVHVSIWENIFVSHVLLDGLDHGQTHVDAITRVLGATDGETGDAVVAVPEDLDPHALRDNNSDITLSRGVGRRQSLSF